MAEAATKIDKVRDVHVNSGRIKFKGEGGNNHHEVVMTPDWTYEDILNPAFWSHIASLFTIGDLIDVRFDDGSNYGQFIVLDCSRLHAKLKRLQWVSLQDQRDSSVEHPDDYKYEWHGPIRKHCVARVSDNEVIQEQLPTKADALQWIANKR